MPDARTGSRRSPRSLPVDSAIAGRAFRQLWVGACVWGVVFGATVASTALTYVKSFPDQASRDQLAASTAGDAGASILLGPITSINSVGGYTVYKCFVFLTTVGAIWGLLAATRLLRGEEDAGRWQLVLSAATRAGRATVATLAALGAGVAVVFVEATLCTVLAGRDAKVGFGLGGSVLYGTSLVVAPAVFVGVGAVASQLARSRRLATGLGAGVFGATFVLRMIADSGPGTRWLLWSTPFGWVERMRPLTHPDPRPLVPAALTIAALAAVAVVLAARRDAGSGVLSSSDVSPPRRIGLGSPLGLAARLEAPVLAAWCAGAAAAAFSLGIIAKIAVGNVPDSIANTLRKFGVEGTFLRQYFGVAFLFVAMIVALVPASQIGSAADEQTSGRLAHVLARPTRRSRLLVERLLLTGVTVAVAGVLGGLFAWIGAASQGVDPGFARTLGAGLNVVPTALLVLGLGAVAFAVAPRLAAKVVYAVVVWSVLIDVLAAVLTGLQGLDRLSVFHYMALAPAQDTDPVAVGVQLLIAAGLCAAAVLVFERRDLATA